MTNSPLRILITDDLAYNRMMLQNALSQLLPKADIHIAENGLAAIEKIKYGAKENHFFQLIFMDFCMPFLNGIDTVSRIRALEQNLSQRAFIVTWSSSKTKPMPLTDECLPKPFMPEELETCLKLNRFIE